MGAILRAIYRSSLARQLAAQALVVLAERATRSSRPSPEMPARPPE